MIKLLVPEAVRGIIEQLNNCGYEAYVVGGCVRDSLLGREPEDWDITTSAKPEEVKAIFGRTIDTGIQHGTVTVMEDHVGYEVTTYRIDGEYEDGRHPKTVEFTASLLEDLKRRDFTINAMAYSDRDGIVDAFGGVEDLEKKVIRCVGNAADRFTEDALRILRAIRFSAQLGFEIEEATASAIEGIAPNLARVSKERIAVELNKLLLSGHPQRIKYVYEMGISPYISRQFEHVCLGKESEELGKISRLPAVKHMRWTGFLRNESGSVSQGILRDLKLDNDTIHKVKTLTELWKQEITPQKPSIRRVMSRLTPELYDDLLCMQELFAAPSYRKNLALVQKLSRQIREDGDCVRLKDLTVTGNDLREAGMKPGPELGAALNRMFELVLEHPEYNSKEALMKVIELDIF